VLRTTSSIRLSVLSLVQAVSVLVLVLVLLAMASSGDDDRTKDESVVNWFYNTCSEEKVAAGTLSRHDDGSKHPFVRTHKKRNVG
jgi:hypothetical protein